MLKSLSLKKSALRELELPVVVKEGRHLKMRSHEVRFSWAVDNEDSLGQLRN